MLYPCMSAGRTLKSIYHKEGARTCAAWRFSCLQQPTTPKLVMAASTSTEAVGTVHTDREAEWTKFLATAKEGIPVTFLLRQAPSVVATAAAGVKALLGTPCKAEHTVVRVPAVMRFAMGHFYDRASGMTPGQTPHFRLQVWPAPPAAEATEPLMGVALVGIRAVHALEAGGASTAQLGVEDEGGLARSAFIMGDEQLGGLLLQDGRTADWLQRCLRRLRKEGRGCLEASVPQGAAQ